MVYRWLQQSAPSYLAEICTPVSTDVVPSHLRCAAHGDIVVHTSFQYEKTCNRFAVSLPLTVRNPSLTLTQKKTMLFCKTYEALPP